MDSARLVQVYIPKRLGRFYLPLNMVGHEPELVRQIMQGLIVVRCEARMDRCAFDYVATGDIFRELGEGETAPTYDLEFGENDNCPRFFAAFRERDNDQTIHAVQHRFRTDFRSDDDSPADGVYDGATGAG